MVVVVQKNQIHNKYFEIFIVLKILYIQWKNLAPILFLRFWYHVIVGTFPHVAIMLEKRSFFQIEILEKPINCSLHPLHTCESIANRRC